MPNADPRLEHLRDIHHLPEFDRLEIQHFFEVYKELEPGKSVEGADWVGRTEAEAEIVRSYERLEVGLILDRDDSDRPVGQVRVRPRVGAGEAGCGDAFHLHRDVEQSVRAGQPNCRDAVRDRRRRPH